jgi:penicillin-binding protein 1A
VVVAFVALHEVRHIYLDREDLPHLEAFHRFELPAIGYVNDRHGQPLIALARERREITRYDDIPPIVRDAILAAEDRRFFTHDGIDPRIIPRVLSKVRVRALIGRLMDGDGSRSRQAIFPQGGSTITQQLVRGAFLQQHMAWEKSRDLQSDGVLPRLLSSVIGARNVSMMLRKREEIRLSLWLEQEMREAYGSRAAAKKEIFARYASLIYMGSGQYGLARAAEHYFGRSLSSFTAEDADLAALLAGIPKAPRDYAPDASDRDRVLRRRNQTLALMAARNFISDERRAAAATRPLVVQARAPAAPLESSAVVAHVLHELTATYPDLSVEDLLHGRIHVDATVDARIQQIANDALRHGLERYEARHPAAAGTTQGAVVVLKNGDGSILAEVGGRLVYEGRATSYSDFNRATESFRQPGSAMKPIVYLAAFEHGEFTLDSIVPDDPISVPDGGTGRWKSIANYDGRFKGPMAVREALAESRNAVAVWITNQVGIGRILRTAQRLGVETPLQPYPSTALGASEITLLELANVYRAIASGMLASPYVIRRVVLGSGEELPRVARTRGRLAVDAEGLALIQEGLRGVVRMPTGTAHALNARTFPIAVMGKTGTTNDFRDALFVGSTYGPDGVTVAVRIGFDDNRSLGRRETGGRVALPVFREVMAAIYGEDLVGPAPVFPPLMERSISQSVQRAAEAKAEAEAVARMAEPVAAKPLRVASPAELTWLRENASIESARLPVVPLAPVVRAPPD